MTPAQIYAAKLRTPEWRAFRDGFMVRIQDEHGDDSVVCFTCGKSDHLQVHHRRYIDGLEPWEYEDRDLILICRDCHENVHKVADAFWDWIISIEPNRAYEARYLLTELKRLDDPGQALAVCKNIVRDLAYALEDNKKMERAGYKLVNGKDILDELVAECWAGRRADK